MIRQRCAIYTRKSTEEGLEQDFNSLDAQREACAAYILSQKHEGWAELSDRYDDGGFSGGSMDRPGLTQLLKDVEAGRVDVIVVYKVDRLTRSLVDFAKMVDLFDGAGVSFVSVTQAFNTTSSMGRLTLNVLLSFAQFEREVTAERIRDKVAASKRKGMWMGGAVPIGYDVNDKALIVNPVEAEAIRTIFAEYLAAGSVRELSDRLEALSIVSKRRTDRYGRTTGGTSFSRGALYNILRNPIYIGKTRHKDELYDGLHEAIIDDATWQQVQELLANHGGKKIATSRRSARRLLDGLLFDSVGRPMRTTYTIKSTRTGGTEQSRRYWYYTSKPTSSDDHSRIERFPAGEVERLVLSGIINHLADKTWLTQQIGSTVDLDPRSLPEILAAADAWCAQAEVINDDTESQHLNGLIDRIDVTNGRFFVQINLGALLSSETTQHLIHAALEFSFKKRQNGRAKPIVIAPPDAPQPDRDLINLVADARKWWAELLDGKSSTVRQIEDREGLRSGSVSRILPLAWLAPDISTAILEGRQPQHLTAKKLRSLPELPLDWQEQRKILGFPHQ
ncbi:recombinase family protein [Sulfitobacter mediterraneus]|uniref:DNA invertase Pin-like site-specific DNA recombinase n=1 Tax=Sulfitobacter mediterraneus TaxID=83219 RepID=A0A2T6CB84_9RHOB|nr:recombinase family protein [Sulfitobacter mediterraneus]KIN76963.1 putative resolvase [Sulfitobacter mediterraneus KCTC 32188]PTX72774.1 DNA invertase Pin-like site-specific DNA recombinase [Sulfitobacter mediterraneus]